MRIVLVEDDHFQAESISSGIKSRFPNAVVTREKTESGFHARLESLVAEPPDLIILDVMLPWALADRKMPEAPAQVRDEGFYRAGLRCRDLLQSRDETKKVPVILYSILERDDLKGDHADAQLPTYLPKKADLKPLLDKIAELLRPRASRRRS